MILEKLSIFEKQYFDVIVSSISDNYITVLYKEKMIYGKIYYNRAYYHLDKQGCSIYSEKDRISVGDSFSAKLLRVNTATGELVFFKETNSIKETYNKEKKTRTKRR